MKKKSKKLNPRRIPLAKSQIKNSDILEEATKDDMFRAWLLVLNALFDQEMISKEEIPELVGCVNRYMQRTSYSQNEKDNNLRRAITLMGIPCPYEHISPDGVKSTVELEAFKKKVRKVAIHTALSVVCLGIDSYGKYDHEQIRRIFFNVDLTLAELEHGTTSYPELYKLLETRGIVLERENDDFQHATVIAPTS